MNKNHFSLLSILIIISCSLYSGDANHLVFNRISIAPDSTEMFTIYNPTDTTIHLNITNGHKYYITDGGINISDGQPIYSNLPFIKKNKVFGYVTGDDYLSGSCGVLADLDLNNDPTNVTEISFIDANGDDLGITYYTGNDPITDGCNLPLKDFYIHDNGNTHQLLYNLSQLPDELVQFSFKIEGAELSGISGGDADDNNFYLNDKYWTEDNSGPSQDFFIEFPENEIIESHETLYISMHANSIFERYYFFEPDYNIYELTGNTEPGTLDILESDNDEMLILFFWDGVSDKIYDVDYFLWGGRAEAINKTGISNYLSDELPELQSYLPLSNEHYSYTRVNNDDGSCCLEYGESELNGNGITGHNEMSEKFEFSWTLVLNPERTLGCMDPIAENYPIHFVFYHS